MAGMESGVSAHNTDRLRLVAVVVTYDRLAQLKVTLHRLLQSPA